MKSRSRCMAVGSSSPLQNRGSHSLQVVWQRRRIRVSRFPLAAPDLFPSRDPWGALCQPGCNDTCPEACNATGAGNLRQTIVEIFADLAAEDFRPGPTSMARGNAEPAIGTTNRLRRGVRPQPDGSPADIGAFEVP